MTDDSMWKAVHRVEAAADSVSRAADRMEEAARRIAYLLEDGYGGNGLRLIELLEGAKAPPLEPVQVPDEWVTWLGKEEGKPKPPIIWYGEPKCEICGAPAVSLVYDMLQYVEMPSGVTKAKHYGGPHHFCRVHTRESYWREMGAVYPPPPP